MTPMTVLLPTKHTYISKRVCGVTYLQMYSQLLLSITLQSHVAVYCDQHRSYHGINHPDSSAKRKREQRKTEQSSLRKKRMEWMPNYQYFVTDMRILKTCADSSSASITSVSRDKCQPFSNTIPPHRYCTKQQHTSSLSSSPAHSWKN